MLAGFCDVAYSAESISLAGGGYGVHVLGRGVRVDPLAPGVEEAICSGWTVVGWRFGGFGGDRGRE